MIVKQLLTSFQQLDLASLQGNYRQFWNRKRLYVQRCQLSLQSLFERLNGFEGNDTIARSGDDVFLLQKAIAHNSWESM
jgi:hypothetical protein